MSIKALKILMQLNYFWLIKNVYIFKTFLVIDFSNQNIKDLKKLWTYYNYPKKFWLSTLHLILSIFFIKVRLKTLSMLKIYLLI